MRDQSRPRFLFIAGALPTLGIDQANENAGADLSAPLPFFRKTPRPLGCVFHQPRPHRVLPEILRFFPPALISTQSVIEPIPLPRNPERLCGPRFPALHHFLHSSRPYKPNQPMHMIRHHDEGGTPPDLTRIAIPHGIKHPLCHCRLNQSIASPVSTANCDEESLFRFPNPKRRLVIQFSGSSL